MFRGLRRFARRHRHAEEVAAEALGVNVAARLIAAVLVSGTASAAIATIATQQHVTTHPSFSLSKQGAAFITRHEGVRYRPYNDPSARPICTVGVGHVLAFRACTGHELATTYSPGQVSALLMHDVSWAETCVRQAITHQIAQPAFDSLVDIVFNAGCGVMSYSGLAVQINHGDLAGVPRTLSHTAVTAGGRYLSGLYTRRLDEGALFAHGYYGAGIGWYKPKPPTLADKLRAHRGYWSWLAWSLGEGAWRGRGHWNPHLRPHAPRPVPRAWWIHRAAFTKARP